jgi:Holliday junction resolvase
MDALTARGAFVWKNHGSAFMMAGLPDIVGVYRGRFLAIETKMPGGQPSIVQVRVMGKIRYAGGAVMVAQSIKEAMTIIDEIDALISG